MWNRAQYNEHLLRRKHFPSPLTFCYIGPGSTVQRLTVAYACTARILHPLIKKKTFERGTVKKELVISGFHGEYFVDKDRSLGLEEITLRSWRISRASALYRQWSGEAARKNSLLYSPKKALAREIPPSTQATGQRDFHLLRFEVLYTSASNARTVYLSPFSRCSYY